MEGTRAPVLVWGPGRTLAVSSGRSYNRPGVLGRPARVGGQRKRGEDALVRRERVGKVYKVTKLIV